jgi:hypothetical protein
MASPCSARVWLLCTFSHSPGLSYLCECVYDEAEWMGREKCKWESCVLCWRVALLSAAWLYTHKFSNPCVLPISLDVAAFVVISCIYLLCPPSRTIIHSVFSLLMRSCGGELEKLSSQYSSNVYGFSEHVENIINFISLRISYQKFLLPILLPPFFPFLLLSRTKNILSIPWNKRKTFPFSDNFVKWNFRKVISVWMSTKRGVEYSPKLNNRTNT